MADNKPKMKKGKPGAAARSPRAISAKYRGSNSRRRTPKKSAWDKPGLGKAMRDTQRGKKPWN